MDYSFVKGTFSEDDLEQAIIELFKEENYQYSKGDDIHRKYEDIILLDDFNTYLNNKYSDANLTPNEIKIIKARIQNVGNRPSLYLNNKEAFYLVTEGFDLERDNIQNQSLHINFIDFDKKENNIFRVVNQYSVQGSKLRRPDLLILINGIPIGICEFKSAIKEDTTIFDAWKQITIRYNRDIENLMTYCFLSIISDGANTKLSTIFTPYEYYYSWNKADDKDKVSNGISSLITMIKGAFAQDRILSILRNFIYYPESDIKEQAIICRYPQYFGAYKMVEHVKAHLRPSGDGKGGTYFGATGCGKTYTMLFMSKLIIKRNNDTFKSPTIIIITDREDLNSQTGAVFEGAKKYLQENDIREFESRKDLKETLKDKESGGVYITTIQKFCEDTGLLSKRSNIICISDEAHRTQINLGSSLKESDEGIIDSYGFAQYLRWSLPNATYCGFTGTPIDETIAVFGKIVDSYTMKESSDDGITVRIAYEPRLARVIVSEEQAKQIEEFYKQCEDEGSTIEQINQSKKAMASISKILSHPDVIKRLAKDIVAHYESLCSEKPNIVQKAMIVCADRELAFNLLNEIIKIRKEWSIPRKSDNDELLSKEDLEKLEVLPKINLVATRDKDDRRALYDACGTKEYRKKLDTAFKNDNSNFKIAVVVDMWITGFDVPSLSVMYINKPLQNHTLIQTISRVNRVFEGKDKGLIVDYVGIKNNMMKALKVYGDPKQSPIDEISLSIEIFRNELSLLDDLMVSFNASKFYSGSPLERLLCLNNGAEYVQLSKDLENKFMDISRKMKSAFEISSSSGELTIEEINKAHFYLAVRSIIFKQTKGSSLDTETMNVKVEDMVKNALLCTGVENIVNPDKEVDIFSDEFLKELDKIKMPITKFNALVRLLKQAIHDYGKVNKVKSAEFTEMLKKVVDKYNSRDNLVFTSEVVEDFVDDLSDEIINIIKKLKEDKESFKKLGITFEEKAFYDILVKVRNSHKFEYDDSKCMQLAKEIKKLVDDKSQFADWSTKSDIKSQLNMELTVLLYDNGYPPQWDDEVFEKVLEQAENFKKFEI